MYEVFDSLSRDVRRTSVVGTRRTYVMQGQFYVSLYTAMYRTWCWAGWHWLGSALRKKARKKGFSTGGIQST
jgi:hypothetical protein